MTQRLKKEQSGIIRDAKVRSNFMPPDLTPGSRMPDGSIYAGVSPVTQKPLYTTPADAPGASTLQQAQEYAATLEAHGRADWRLPTKDELRILFENRAAVGGFNLDSRYPLGWYWSSSQDVSIAWRQRFSDGRQNLQPKDKQASVRCVRTDAI